MDTAVGYKHRKASPKPNRAILVRWLRNNIIRPNPTTQQISVLAEQADMTYVQVKNWFGNTRRTLKKKGPKGADEWLQRHDTHSADPSYMVAVKQFHDNYPTSKQPNSPLQEFNSNLIIPAASDGPLVTERTERDSVLGDDTRICRQSMMAVDGDSNGESYTHCVKEDYPRFEGAAQESSFDSITGACGSTLSCVGGPGEGSELCGGAGTEQADYRRATRMHPIITAEGRKRPEGAVEEDCLNFQGLNLLQHELRSSLYPSISGRSSLGMGRTSEKSRYTASVKRPNEFRQERLMQPGINTRGCVNVGGATARSLQGRYPTIRSAPCCSCNSIYGGQYSGNYRQQRPVYQRVSPYYQSYESGYECPYTPPMMPRHSPSQYFRPIANGTIQSPPQATSCRGSVLHHQPTTSYPVVLRQNLPPPPDLLDMQERTKEVVLNSEMYAIIKTPESKDSAEDPIYPTPPPSVEDYNVIVGPRLSMYPPYGPAITLVGGKKKD